MYLISTLHKIVTTKGYKNKFFFKLGYLNGTKPQTEFQKKLLQLKLCIEQLCENTIMHRQRKITTKLQSVILSIIAHIKT